MPLALPGSDPQPLAPGLHRTDAFHRQPLFAVQPAGRHAEGPVPVVRSWREAHALHGPARLDDLNPAYIAALISGDANAAVSPYRRIQRLPRAHRVHIPSDGRRRSAPYDPLAGGAGPMPAEALHAFIRAGFLDHLQRCLRGHPGALACEHSSGLDSNAVLGGLVHGLGVAPERLHTWSYEGGGEGPLLERFRPFHRLQPAHCHRPEPQDQLPARDAAAAERQALQLIQLYGATPQIGGNPEVLALFQGLGCSLLFSGFGGDQALSHNAANVPTDLVAQGRWRDLVRWMGRRRAALRSGAGRWLSLRSRRWAQAKVMAITKDFCHSDLLERSLTPEGRRWLGPHLRSSYPWEIDFYVPQHQSIRRRVLADWVAVRVEEESRLAEAHGMAAAYPLLDELLIGTLLQQDPALFGEGANRGRLIHRRAFEPFLPPLLRENPSKNRDLPEDSDARIISSARQSIETWMVRVPAWTTTLSRWWDVEAIRREADTLMEQSSPAIKDLVGVADALATASNLHCWLVQLES